MKYYHWCRRVIAGVVAIVMSVSMASAVAGGKYGGGYAAPDWAGSWAAAPSAPGPFDAPISALDDQTIRQVVRLSAGGRSLRVHWSNLQGTGPLTIGGVTVTRHLGDGEIAAHSLRTVTFNGAESVVIAPGASVVSDPVRLRTRPLAELAISAYFPAGASLPGSPVTTHVRALQTAYVGDGDQTDADELVVDSTLTSWLWLEGVDVATRRSLPVIAMLGDSITNGDESTPDANNRFPDQVAERLFRWRGQRGAGILNLGISGNQVTNTLIGANAQARLDRDVLAQSGVTHMVLLEGINDLGLPPLLGVPAATSDAIISGLAQMATRARTAGLTVIGGTITPSGGFVLPTYGSPETEAARQAVNAWIRSTDAFDAVVDFDAVLADPDNPNLMRSDLTADGLHPNDAGYDAMARALVRVLNGKGRRAYADDDDDDEDDD